MNKVHLFITTRTDPVEDLDSFSDYAQFAKWAEEVKPHALKYRTYHDVVADIINDVRDYDILEYYAIVLYPKGKTIEASGVGEKLRKLLFDNRSKLRLKLQKTGKSASTKHDDFAYGMLADPTLKEEEYVVYVEIVSQA